MAHEDRIVELRNQYMPDGDFDEAKYGFNSITKETFASLLSQYSSIVPAKTKDLETQRLETIPDALQQRSGPSYLTKPELATLMDWKLSHGKFRPTLKSLIQQNSAESVCSTTQQGFGFLTPASDKSQLKLSITTLTALKGVGPATASLLLSVHDPANVVFFGDEIFRWACYDSVGAGGWSRPIKYSLAEYLMLAESVGRLRKRLGKGVRSLDVEMVGYVLGKIGSGQSINREKQSVGEIESRKRKGSRDKKAGTATKRAKTTTSGDDLANTRSMRSRN
nr:hypothetical protein CFP56_43867 [Quercus suber]